MKRYTYSLYDRNGNKTKTVICTSNEPIGVALETYITSAMTPQYLAEINIIVDKIEDIVNDDICPDCEGAGELAGDYFSDDGMITCQRCGGKGTI